MSRSLSALALYLLVGLLGACSGSQQQGEEDLEATQQGEQGGEDQQQSEQGQSQQGAEEGGEQGNYENAEQGTEGEAEGQQAAVEETTGEEGSETESGLAAMIEELNNQNGAAPAADAGAAAPMDSTAMADASQGAGGAAPAAAPPASSGATIPFQPGGTPAGQGLPELGSKMPYIVQKGDTLAKISAMIYGTPSKWREMANLTGLENPSRIFPGDLVYYTLTDSAVPFAQTYENLPRSEEAIQPGDTLITISNRVYGTREGWKSIWRQNDNIQDPEQIPAGGKVFYINTTQLATKVAAAKKADAAAKLAASKIQTKKIGTTVSVASGKRLLSAKTSKIAKDFETIKSISKRSMELAAKAAHRA
jgi:nucleoid-associated protein YgaU